MVIRFDPRAGFRFLGYYAAGAAIVSATWVAAAERFRRETQQQVAEVKDYYKRQYELDRIKLGLAAKVYKAETVADVVEAVEEEQEVVKTNYNPLNRVPDDLKDTLRSYGEKQVTEQSRSYQRPEGRPLHPKSRGPVISLTREEYYADSDEDFPHQEKVSVLYYEKDDVIVDPFDEVMDGYSTVLGVEFLGEFVKHGGQQFAFVRNTTLKMDYEIELQENGSYHEDVLGYMQEPEPRKPRKFRDEE